ncbi:MAG: hypothetical protein M3N51_08235 [Actinomycetota bacterium]|nr:hypothetical protein [Actinomycetota bacterium]
MAAGVAPAGAPTGVLVGAVVELLASVPMAAVAPGGSVVVVGGTLVVPARGVLVGAVVVVVVLGAVVVVVGAVVVVLEEGRGSGMGNGSSPIWAEAIPMHDQASTPRANPPNAARPKYRPKPCRLPGNSRPSSRRPPLYRACGSY